MKSAEGQEDMIVLAADRSIKIALTGLLQAAHRIGVRPVQYEIEVHPEHDPGCLRTAATILRSRLRRFDRALVVLDRDGCGSDESRVDLQLRIEHDLEVNGWNTRAKAIVIDPELETWLWAGEKAAREALGWRGTYGALRERLRERGLWQEGSPKPTDPKRAANEVLRWCNRRRSSKHFLSLGESASLASCTDSAFGELRETLQRWFPVSSASDRGFVGR